MPSTTSSSFSRPEPSSTVMTPSLPTLSIASAMILPMASSELAEMVPTWAIALLSVQGLDIFLSSATAADTALSIPRFKSIGFMPAATDFLPSRRMAWASTVAVVVPSPAMSDVCEASSFTFCAPMFSNLSLSSISFATDTPSFVIVGAPKLFSSTTLRPFGPSVTLTAFARMFTPFTMRARASSLNLTSFAAISIPPKNSVSQLTFEHGHDVVFAHHQQLLAVDLHLGAGIFSVQPLVAAFHVQGTHLDVVDDLAVDQLLGSAIGNHDAARGLTLFFQAADDHTIMYRTHFHSLSPLRLN